MKRRALILLLAGLVGLGALYLRQAELTAYAPDQVNGCGRWGGGWLVPDLWFRAACDAHDLCVQHGEPDCAEAFYQDMRGACVGQGAVCDTVAEVYAWFAGWRR